jgi:hypothetical protein
MLDRVVEDDTIFFEPAMRLEGVCAHPEHQGRGLPMEAQEVKQQQGSDETAAAARQPWTQALKAPYQSECVLACACPSSGSIGREPLEPAGGGTVLEPNPCQKGRGGKRKYIAWSDCAPRCVSEIEFEGRRRISRTENWRRAQEEVLLFEKDFQLG